MFDLIIAQEWDGIQLRLIIWATVIFIAWIGMAVACFVDMLSGVSTARAIGERLHSHRLRETFQKIKDYAGVMFPFMFIDIIGSLFTFYFLPFFQIVVSTGAIIIEGWSVLENKKRKKSHAALIPELAKEIIQCAREKDAEAIIETIQSLSHKNKNDNGNTD